MRLDADAVTRSLEDARRRQRAKDGLPEVVIIKIKYMATLVVNRKFVTFDSYDLDVFVATIKKYQLSFPNIPIQVTTYVPPN